MSAYLNDLQRSTPATVPQSQALRARVRAWFESLPPFTRQRPYAMSEIEAALNRPGRILSPALLALGWQRKRQWQSRTHYHRYWVPPAPDPPSQRGVTTTSGALPRRRPERA